MYTRIQGRYRPPSRKFKLITHCKLTEIDLPPPSSDKHNILDPRKLFTQYAMYTNAYNNLVFKTRRYF